MYPLIQYVGNSHVQYFYSVSFVSSVILHTHLVYISSHSPDRPLKKPEKKMKVFVAVRTERYKV